MLKNTCKNIPNASTIEAIKEGKKIINDLLHLGIQVWKILKEH